MRVSRQSSGEQPHPALRQGQVVRGRVVQENGRHLLHFRGSRIPVTIEGVVPEEVARFSVSLLKGEVVLHLLPEGQAPEGGKGGDPVAATVLKKLLSFFNVPDPGQAVLRRLNALSPRALLAKVFFLVLSNPEANKAVRMLRLYLESNTDKKNGVNPQGESDDIKKEGLSALLDGLQSLFPEMEPVAGRQREGEQSKGERENRKAAEFVFLLFPIRSQDGSPGWVPLLCIGTKKKEQRAWLYSECEVSGIGQVRIMLFMAGDQVHGELVCQPGSGAVLQSVLSDERWVVREQTLSGTFGEWPLNELLKRETGFFDGQA